MDRERFDELTRLLSREQPRRVVLGSILGAALLGRGSHVLAAPGRAKGKGHSKDHGRGHDKGRGQGHENDKLCRDLSCGKLAVPEGDEPEFCCKGGFCSCGGKCCADACFWKGPEDALEDVVCCTGPKWVVCRVEIDGIQTDTCCEGSCEACAPPGPSGIAGSYRRR